MMQDGESRNVDTINDELMERYQVLFEVQTVRKKLMEYEQNGLFMVKKKKAGSIYIRHTRIG